MLVHQPWIGFASVLGRRRRGQQDEMDGWHHWLDGRESGWTPGVGDGQGGLACCDSWGCKVSDTTERLNWTELGAVYWNNFEVTFDHSFFTDSPGSFCQWFTFIVYTLCIRPFKNQGLDGLYFEKLPIPSSESNFPNGCSTQEENVTNHIRSLQCNKLHTGNQRAHMAYTCVHVCVRARVCVLVYTWPLLPWYKTVPKELAVLAVLIFTVNVQKLHLCIP